MAICKAVPPAASPITALNLVNGLTALCGGTDECRTFAADICRVFGVDYCFLLSTGTAGLSLLLRALKRIHPGKTEVVIPAFTCNSIPSAVAHEGLTCRLCDVNPSTLDYDYDRFPECLRESDHILCVIVPHLFGLPADIERASAIAHSHGLAVIEDAAQAFGNEIRGKKLGTQGDAGLFSFGKSKALSTYEGGIIVTNNAVIGEHIAQIALSLPTYSITETARLICGALAYASLLHPRVFWLPRGIPYLRLGRVTRFQPEFVPARMTPFQAGLARGWERKIEHLRSVRRTNALKWAAVCGRKHYHTNLLVNESKCGPVRFPLLAESRMIRNRIIAEGVMWGAGVTYRVIRKKPGLALTENPDCYRGALTLEHRLLGLPTHPFAAIQKYWG
ncbi:MAG: aminotransferase DegT [Chitinivibrionales bacterium]|nr:aminotransferase DegT [Chitinivibrionales bacterium]MBD3358607.1 aminotransferase DegT [Chitinivibrionales bacterium]